MTDLYKAVKDGAAARNMLESDTFREILSALDQDIYRKWCNTQDAEKRHELWLEQKVVKSMLTRLHNLVEDGKIAEASLKG